MIGGHLDRTARSTAGLRELMEGMQSTRL